MNRLDEEKQYWNLASLDPDVDKKYICDLDNEPFFKALGELPTPVLEIGCGVGRLMQPGYTGVDISKGMLKIAKKRKPECHFFHCNGRILPFEDKEFQSVYCVLLFQHLPEEGVKSYLKEAYRVLRKGGTFRFQFIQGRENEPFSHHFTLDDMDDWAQEAGFLVTQIDEKLIHINWTWFTAKKE